MQGTGCLQDYKEHKIYSLLIKECNCTVWSRLDAPSGLGVLQDYKEAVRFYRLAADQGDAQAQSNLGWMYEKGLVFSG